jgi:hypothetical protein
MREHPPKFFNYTRMSIKQFDKLLEMISPNLEVRDDYYHRPIPNELRLVVTLRYKFGLDYVLISSKFFSLN